MEKNKTVKHSFRITESDNKKLLKDMEKTEYSKLSQYIRYKCLLDIDVNKNLLVANSLKDELKVFNYEINRIGNNINQIAKAIYTNNISHKSAIEELQNDMKYLYKFAIDLNKKISDR